MMLGFPEHTWDVYPATVAVQANKYPAHASQNEPEFEADPCWINPLGDDRDLLPSEHLRASKRTYRVTSLRAITTPEDRKVKLVLPQGSFYGTLKGNLGVNAGSGGLDFFGIEEHYEYAVETLA